MIFEFNQTIIKIIFIILGLTLVNNIAMDNNAFAMSGDGSYLLDKNSTVIPPALDSYRDKDLKSLKAVIKNRIEAQPFNLIATIIFFLAILHTFIAPFFLGISKKMQKNHEAKLKTKNQVSFASEMLHFIGEVEVVFGLWVLVLLGAFIAYFDFNHGIYYMTYKVNYTEPVFMVVIMTLAATKPICDFTRMCLGLLAKLGKNTPLSWWVSILTVAPLLGSLITEPAAMTVAAMLLGKEFYTHNPSAKLKYATIGLLFVNISAGGVFTNFAAPPVLMVAQKWNWSSQFMLENFGWKAFIGIILSNLIYFICFHKELLKLGNKKASKQNNKENSKIKYAPWWVILFHIIFIAWTVMMAHYPVFFIGGFLFFLGFYKATKYHQEPLALQQALLVGFFLSGLVIHGGLQGWWIEPVLSSLNEKALMLTAIGLTSVNDNAAITYLSTLIPNFSDSLKYAVVAGAISGGGLTVIANAPNPAGQSILAKYFTMERIHPLYLLCGALIPTIIVALMFKYL